MITSSDVRGFLEKQAAKNVVFNKFFGSGDPKKMMKKVIDNPYIPMSTKKKLFESIRENPMGAGYTKTSPLNLAEEIDKLPESRRFSYDKMNIMGSIAETFKKPNQIRDGWLVRNQPTQGSIQDLINIKKDPESALFNKFQEEYLPIIRRAKQEEITRAIKYGDNSNSALSSWNSIQEKANKAFSPYFIPQQITHGLYQNTSDIVRGGIFR